MELVERMEGVGGGIEITRQRCVHLHPKIYRGKKMPSGGSLGFGERMPANLDGGEGIYGARQQSPSGP